MKLRDKKILPIVKKLSKNNKVYISSLITISLIPLMFIKSPSDNIVKKLETYDIIKYNSGEYAIISNAYNSIGEYFTFSKEGEFNMCSFPDNFTEKNERINKCLMTLEQAKELRTKLIETENKRVEFIKSYNIEKIVD
jgi:hypothetical protein